MIQHLSPSSIIEYATDPQLFYKKYVRKERDDKTWIGTIIGSGVHQVLDRYISTGSKPEISIREYIDEQTKLFTQGSLVLNDCTDVNEFTQAIQEGILRVIPNALTYVHSNFLDAKLVTEVTYRMQIGETLGLEKTTLPMKCISDVVDIKNHKMYDWKVVKSYDDLSPARIVQAVINAMLYAEHSGTMPKEFTYVEFLRLPTFDDKMIQYEADLLVWEQNKKVGDKVPKPRKPTGKPKPRMREMVITIEDWHVKVVMQLIKNITDQIMGINILAEGRAIPNLTPKFGYDGWVDFCTQVLGYDPYSGELGSGATTHAPLTAEDLPF